MRWITFFLCLLLSFSLSAETIDSTTSKLYKFIPNSTILQFAGNIGMFSTGVRYVTPNKHWKGAFLYGFVPARYAADKPIHSVTVKGQYSTMNHRYGPTIQIEWLNVGLWYNYSFGRSYFSNLPRHYDDGYYYFPTAINIGLTLGSELRHKKWGLYYEIGTTDKRVINFVKSPKAVSFREIWNIGIGIVYHLKQEVSL
ncbi:hypothetical protein [Sphingobacterium yanglingense]|uniref:Outer membrane protein with beta-barrel domain n=1 Tax=Sphingobacterium yanglingense TaxID=1437280 RepID=A0A4R6WSB9_9SPHI|nr:hypothetical protein [Sphingobacterium yanglingense]TDQ82898.1 hypothetical protein CLV99_0120 [Sphingobacterium yanglingense]